ncbi:MAG: hypothetical protein QOI04_1115 [Verrucomicrobiota bacterium]|jgi:autotransporter-associated beta strand protein
MSPHRAHASGTVYPFYARITRALGWAYLVLALGSVEGASTWNGGGGNVNWSTAGNWTGGTPTSSSATNIFFAGNTNLGTAGTPLNQNIASPFTLNNLTFSAGGGAFFLGGSAITFTTGANNSITQSSFSAENIANAISATDNSTVTLTLDGAGSGVVTLAGAITKGSGGRDYAIVKNGSSTFSLTGTNNYTGGTTINGGTLCINSAASLGATTSGLTINAGTLEVATGFTTTRVITLSNAASTLQIDPSQTYTVTSAIGGFGALNKTGTGTLVLSGSNTFIGGTVVSAGTVQISASERLSNFGALTVSGGTFDVQTFTETVAGVTLTSGSISGTGTGTLSGSSYDLRSGSVSAILAGTGVLTKSTAGTVTLTGANTYSGGTSIAGGTLVLGSAGALGTSGTIGFAGGTLQYTSSNTTDYSARFSNAINQNYKVDTNGQNVTLASAITSMNGTFTKLGTGTLTLSSLNAYTGATTVSAGTLQLNISGALGTLAGSTTVANGAALKLNGVNYAVAEALTLNGTGIGNAGALTNSGTSTYAGAVTIATNATINPGGGILNFTGGLIKDGTTLTFAGGGTVNILVNGISGSSANSDLVVDGTTVVLDTPNSYNGPTTIQNSGTIQLGANNVFPTSPETALTINTSSVLDMASFSDSVASLTGDSTAIVKNSSALTTSTLTVNPDTGVSTTFAGVVAGTNSGAQGNMALVKSGAGTLILTGANTYTGTTTVNAGSLFINGNDSFATGAVTVNNSGSTLGGSGTIGGSVTVASAANLSPGASGSGSTAILRTGAVTLSSGSNFNVDLNSTTAGTGYDQLSVTGTVSLSGSNLLITAGAGLSIGDKFFVVLNDGSDPITGTFAQSSPTIASNNGDLFSINYLDNGDGGATGNDISLTVVALPEPSTYIAGILTLAALAFHQRKRLKKILF